MSLSRVEVQKRRADSEWQTIARFAPIHQDQAVAYAAHSSTPWNYVRVVAFVPGDTPVTFSDVFESVVAEIGLDAD